jgi:methyl-accepting chemotaxis protein
MTLTRRLLTLCLVAITASVLLGAAAIGSIRKTMLEDRRAQIRTMALMGEAMLQHYQGLESTGKLTRAQAQAAAAEALTHLNHDGKAYYFVREANGYLWAHPNAKIRGTIPTSQAKSLDGRPDGVVYAEAMAAAPDGVGLVTLLVKRPGGEVLEPKINGVKAFAPWGWWVGSGFFMADIDEAFWAEVRLFAGLCLGAVLVLGLLCWRFTRAILGSIGGEPTDAARLSERIAAGDLRAEATEPSDAAAGHEHTLMGAMARMRQQLSGTVAAIRSSAAVIDQGSREIADGNNDLSQRTEEQAAALQRTASSLEALTEAVQHNADHAAQARELTRAAAEVAGRGHALFADMVSNMEGISESSRKVSEIIGTIDGIAFQTNILALNAAVEAARAGEQGRGFAVVAGEVRALAQRSSGAAREIKQLIESAGSRVDGGTRLVNGAGQTMTEILASVQRAAALIDEMAAASTRQSADITEVSQAVREIDRVTQQNTARVEEAAAAAMSLAEQSRRLNDSVARFQVAQA